MVEEERGRKGEGDGERGEGGRGGRDRREKEMHNGTIHTSLSLPRLKN